MRAVLPSPQASMSNLTAVARRDMLLHRCSRRYGVSTVWMRRKLTALRWREGESIMFIQSHGGNITIIVAALAAQRVATRPQRPCTSFFIQNVNSERLIRDVYIFAVKKDDSGTHSLPQRTTTYNSQARLSINHSR